MMTKKSKSAAKAESDKDFRDYVAILSDAQLQGVYHKEKAAGRHDQAEMAVNEAFRRNVSLVLK